MKAPEKLYLVDDDEVLDLFPVLCLASTEKYDNDIEYTRNDIFIERACGWIKENITNNPNANSILARNGCVTLGMLIEDFKKYMED